MGELLSVMQKATDEEKEERALLHDPHRLDPFIDHVVICSVLSIRQTHAIADSIKGRVRKNGYETHTMGGNDESRWVLVDLNSTVVHVFINEKRDHFQLEKLYAGLPCEDLSLWYMSC